MKEHTNVREDITVTQSILGCQAQRPFEAQMFTCVARGPTQNQMTAEMEDHHCRIPKCS